MFLRERLQVVRGGFSPQGGFGVQGSEFTVYVLGLRVSGFRV